MSVTMTCPHCGPIHVCDHCRKPIKTGRLEAKIVHHAPLAATPVVWGEWCSRACFLADVDKGFAGRSIAETAS